MKIRSLKPEFWDDEEVANLTPMARLTLIGLICHADDEGRLRARATFVRSELFPYDDEITDRDVDAYLGELHEAGKVVLYGNAKQRYACIPNFVKHQYIRRPQESALPAPCDEYPIIRGGVQEPLPDAVRTVATARPYGGGPDRKGLDRKGGDDDRAGGRWLLSSPEFRTSVSKALGGIITNEHHRDEWIEKLHQKSRRIHKDAECVLPAQNWIDATEHAVKLVHAASVAVADSDALMGLVWSLAPEGKRLDGVPLDLSGVAGVVATEADVEARALESSRLLYGDLDGVA